MKAKLPSANPVQQNNRLEHRDDSARDGLANGAASESGKGLSNGNGLDDRSSSSSQGSSPRHVDGKKGGYEDGDEFLGSPAA